MRAAARKMGQTQPALSKGLMQLEEEFCVPLVLRTARGASLTAYGQAMVRRGQGIVHELERIREEIDQMRGMQEGGVSLGIAPSPALLLLPDALRRFHRELPNVQVRLREAVYPDVLQLLREGIVDVAVGPVPTLRKTSTAEFRSEKLYANALVVTCRQGHPKAQARSLLELLDCEWLQHGPSEGPGALHTSVFRDNGLKPPIPRVHSESFIASLNLLENSDSLSLLPERLITHISRNGRLFGMKLVEPMPNWDVALITRANSPLTPAAQKLVLALRRTPPSGS